MNTNQKLLEAHLPVFERLQKDYPKKNVLFAAIENLKTKEEIQEFFHRYIKLLKQKIKKGAIKTAKDNISYISGYYNNKQEILDRWAIVLN